MTESPAWLGAPSDWWLVITVSALVGAIGAALAVSARAEPGVDAMVLGAGSAVGLGLVDLVYVGRGRISPVYLLDAAVELPIAIAWLASHGTPEPGGAVAHTPRS